MRALPMEQESLRCHLHCSPLCLNDRQLATTPAPMTEFEMRECVDELLRRQWYGVTLVLEQP